MPAEIVGVEHEFEVVEHGERIDFRTLIDDVVGGADRRWFPMDPYARFLPSGAVVTCDGWEAEIATPPVRTRRGLASAVADEVLSRRTELGTLVRRFNERCGRSIELRGYSTHLNAFVPAGRAPEVAVRYARTVAPAMMLLLDLASSPGALVRPRDRRLEIGGEFVGSRDDLRVALAFFIATTMATERGLAMPELDGTLVEDPARGGWFVDRTAYGDDLYVDGRMASLALAGGGTILAGTLLGETWALARPLLEPYATDEELALVDDTVSGARPLPLEREPEPEPEFVPVAPVQAFARILTERRRGEIVVRPASVNWQAATMQVTTPSRTFFARIPLEGYASFAAQFDRGALDRPLRAYGSRPPRGRIVTPGTLGFGLYDEADIPQPDAAGKPARVGERPVAARPKRPHAVVTVARRAAVLAGAAAMFVGTAAFAYLGLRQSESRATSPIDPRPRTSVLAGRESREASPEPSQIIPSSNEPSGAVVPLVPTQAPATQAKPTVRASTSSKPKPRPTSTPTRRATPTPTPTPTPTEPPPTGNGPPVITGSTSCSVGSSRLSFTVRVPEGSPKVKAMDIQYNNTHLSPTPSPNYPYGSYSGSSTGATAPGGNHRWVVVVQTMSNEVTTKQFPPDGCP